MSEVHKALKTWNDFMLFQKIQKYRKDTNTTCWGPGYLWQVKYFFMLISYLKLDTIQCTGTSKHAKLQHVR